MNRRQFFKVAGAAGLIPWLPPSGGSSSAAGPAFIRRDAARPGVPFGVAAGDVTSGRALVWSRTDRSARMFVEYSTTESFTNVRRVQAPAALESTDFTSRITLTKLPDG